MTKIYSLEPTDEYPTEGYNLEIGSFAADSNHSLGHFFRSVEGLEVVVIQDYGGDDSPITLHFVFPDPGPGDYVADYVMQAFGKDMLWDTGRGIWVDPDTMKEPDDQPNERWYIERKV